MRETEEEIGIQIKRSQIFKTLTEVYIPPSNFLVQPYLALVSETPIFKPNYEVEKILTPFLSELINPKIIQQDVRSKNGIFRKSHGFILENEFVWGATAMILSEIKDLFDKIYK
jgi:8-oxo-dGTP pyrophosphatase MutT (NUDIX family)